MSIWRQRKVALLLSLDQVLILVLVLPPSHEKGILNKPYSQKQIWSILWYFSLGKLCTFSNILDNFHLRFSNIHIIIIDFIQSSSDIRRKIELASMLMIMIVIMTITVMTTVIIVMIRKAPPHLLISSERLDQHMWPININIIVDWSIHYITWE